MATMRVRGVQYIAITVLVAGMAGGCGGGGGASATARSSDPAAQTAAGPTATGGATSSGGSASTDDQIPDAPRRSRSGLAIHIQNVRAHGALPDDSATRTDALQVAFEIELVHNGTEPLSGLQIQQARLVEDSGRAVTFGVTGDGWNGELQVGERRVVSFTKTPDSASPRAYNVLCNAWMRLEITLQLAGRSATATSRRVQVTCP